MSTARWFFSLLSEQCEESALPMVSSLISESCRYEGLVLLEDSWMKISVVSEKWLSSKNLAHNAVRGALLTNQRR